jgi:lysyl-tRNA synthetase class 1
MESLFWADQKAREIVTRKKYHYLNKGVPRFDRYVIKTSASISGVLHIGRLSDTIRGEAVCKALRDAGYESELIWVAEDMDPLRKIPEGVSEEFAEYIGTPVVSVPDPWGCHSSYAEHHVEEYFQVLHEFLDTDLTKYSMREEYSKGNFRPYITKMLEMLDEVRAIQEKYRREPLKRWWNPWTPICEGCGKIITPRIKSVREGLLSYRCEDYSFEKTIARGCGYEGEVSPLKGDGKLMWKGEWAAQWARWKVASEGAGKEYVVPTSAWWVNAEIVEKILDFPMPVPIFYEHLMIDGRKMSASLGNVVYPREWLSVAEPQLLRFFYNKKLMKTRSFSWSYLPNLYDEYDAHAREYQRGSDDKRSMHRRRLYEISQIGEVQKPVPLSYSHAALLARVYPGEREILASLKRSGHYDREVRELILRRIRLAANWVKKYAPPELRAEEADPGVIGRQLDEGQRKLLSQLVDYLQMERTPEEIQGKIHELGASLGLSPRKTFQAIYMAVMGLRAGPKAGGLLASLDRKWLVDRLRRVAEAG